MTEPRPLRVKILLNKGKKTVSLHRLPKLLTDIQRFLDSLSEDTVGRAGDWVGLDFRSTKSIEYTAERLGAVEVRNVDDFQTCLRGVLQSKPDPKLRRSTLQQYAKITEPLDDDTVSFGLETQGVDALSNKSVEWIDVDKQSALALPGTGQSLVKSHGSIQGIMQSLFLESPHFYLKELSSGKRVLCEYDISKHGEVVEALERPKAVIHVYGLIWTDLIERETKRIDVSRIVVSRSLRIEDLKRLIGAVSDSDTDSLQTFIDESRGRGQA